MSKIRACTVVSLHWRKVHLLLGNESLSLSKSVHRTPKTQSIMSALAAVVGPIPLHALWSHCPLAWFWSWVVQRFLKIQNGRLYRLLRMIALNIFILIMIKTVLRLWSHMWLAFEAWKQFSIWLEYFVIQFNFLKTFIMHYTISKKSITHFSGCFSCYEFLHFLRCSKIKMRRTTGWPQRSVFGLFFWLLASTEYFKEKEI